MRFGLFLPPFDDLSDPALLLRLAVAAEDAGWDGVFLWDHIVYREPVRAAADPWVALAGIAAATRRVRLGALVTPLARRRPHVLARALTTLDHLSEGRLVVGVGLGLDTSGRELSAFGEEMDDRVRGRMLDEALQVLDALWSGETVHHRGEHYTADGVRFLPTPVQPRIPVWVAGRWPNRAPLRRAVARDGMFPIQVERPEELAELAGVLTGMRGSLDGFDLVVMRPPGGAPAPWAAAGATWWLTALDPFTLTAADAEALAHGGPPAG
ncbi:MAG: LLM class flavin-dependent oxidoreductase [Thermoleophilia bacterium]